MRWGRLARIIGFAVSCVSIAIVVGQVDLVGTTAVLSRASLAPSLVALGALALQFIALAARWRLLLPLMPNGRPVPYRAVVEALMIGNLANAALPARLGEVVRTFFVARRAGVDTAASAGTVLLERVLDIAILAGAGLLAAFAADAPWFLTQPLAIVAAVGVVAIGLVASGAMPRVVRLIATRVPGRPRHATIYRGLRWAVRAMDSLHAGRRLSILGLALVATVVSVLLDGMIFWAVGASLAIDIDWAQALLLGTAGILATGVPSAPANIGTFELAVAWVGVALGIPTDAGLALALVAHAVIVLPLSIAGGVVLLRSSGTAQMLAEAKEEADDFDGAHAPSADVSR